LLWKLHEDHHKRTHPSFFERNDFFFVIFATPGILCLYAGKDAFSTVFWVGLGITLYGMAYFFVHDIFIHQRFKVLTNTKSLYFLAIRRAHKAHHKHIGKYDGECFGMLWAPLKYYAEARKLLAK
jgi:beta-carotene 3-hydroxylase